MSPPESNNIPFYLPFETLQHGNQNIHLYKWLMATWGLLFGIKNLLLVRE
jgi:hypothetical protein